MSALLTVTRTFDDGDQDSFTVTSERPLHEAVEIARKEHGAPGTTGPAYDCSLTASDREQGITRVTHSWTDPDQLDLLDALEEL